MDTNMATKPSSPFLALPLELRELIYDYVFQFRGSNRKVRINKYSPAFTSISRIGVLRASRQVYEEALPRLYKHKIFVFWYYSDTRLEWEQIVAWLRKIPCHIHKHITIIELWSNEGHGESKTAMQRQAEREETILAQGRLAIEEAGIELREDTFKIPPELRNLIYEIVLTFADPIEFTVKKVLSGRECIAFFGIGVRQPLAMIKACKTIHNEASQLVFSCNALRICRDDLVGVSVSDLGAVADTMGSENASIINTIVLDAGFEVSNGELGIDANDLEQTLPEIRHGHLKTSSKFPHSRTALRVPISISTIGDENQGNQYCCMRNIWMDDIAGSLHRIADELEQAAVVKQNATMVVGSSETNGVAAVIRAAEKYIRGLDAREGAQALQKNSPYRAQ
ncbi:hypothetical protein LTR56_009500 [Elasticomyces elasticus]|nr:hypothetical protein LTR22_021484 [Elasticomyces elasticus]KAK3644835.1 hypothetical protein LTR56_009500 [Elasticomyces elasticus]KAK4930981.1 hypothetical protein LTR49_002396 [Elasticomyces elasticus]KAK5742542.1 hypothetical protein LTS12_024215 [Elasticomyces elasticus]